MARSFPPLRTDTETEWDIGDRAERGVKSTRLFTVDGMEVAVNMGEMGRGWNRYTGGEAGRKLGSFASNLRIPT